MRLLPCLAIAALASSLAAADPPPPAFIPAEAVVAVQVPDLARSRTRWAATPYPRLLQTGWGRLLQEEWGGRLERHAPGAGEALASVRSLACGVRADGSAAAAAEAGPLLGMLLNLGKAPGRSRQYGPVVAWASAGEPVPGQAPPAPGAESDAAFDLHPPGAPAIRVELRLDACGLREMARCAPSEALRLAAQQPRTWADAQELRRLPATTLWAATWHGDAQLAAALPGLEAERLAPLEAILARARLPTLRETLAAGRGPSTIWLAESVPFPAVTAALSIEREVATRWVAAATAALNLAPDAGRGASGFVGLIPIAIGLVPDGRLVITTDPRGTEAWTAVKPGFAEQPGVAETLASVPPRTLLLGASRGGAAWAALAQLCVPMFVAMGAPQAVSLPVDLKAAAPRGWLYLRLGEDGALASEAGGLCGGPVGVLVAVGVAVPATLWIQEQLRRERRLPEAPEAAPPSVF